MGSVGTALLAASLSTSLVGCSKKKDEETKAKAELDDICRRLLANTVIENYEIELT